MNLVKDTIVKTTSHISKMRRETIIAIAAIAMGYYNIFVYGYATSVIVFHFFPQSSPLIIVLAILMSYIMGPLGAIICGHIGDTRGRKKILAWTMTFVSISSFFISVLPTYDQIGITASILFIIIKSIQTLAFGGDSIGLITFILEDVPAGRRGLFGGLMSMGSATGVVFSSLAITLLDPLQDPTSPWKWRVLLGSGIFGMVLAIYFFRTFGETETFRNYKEKYSSKMLPIVDLFKNNKSMFVRILGLTALVPIITIIVFGFIPYHGMTHLRLSPTLSMWSNTLAVCVFAIFAPFFGALSDRLGRKPVLLSVALTFLILGFPLFVILDYTTPQMFFFIQVLFALVASAYYGVTSATCIEHFPTHVRYSGVALGYFITYALFGGINGLFIIRLLIADIHIDISPVFYLLLGSAIVFLSALFIKEEAGRKLPDKI